MDCSCHHAASEHGTAAQFGTSICLVPDCDCEGTAAELEAERLAKQVVKNARTEHLVKIIAAYVPDEVKCRAIAADVIAGFDMEIL